MKIRRIRTGCVVAAAVSSGSLLIFAAVDSTSSARTDVAKQQVPTWSKDDLNFFLHGSMSTEVIPEAVLRAFIKTYPDLFPASDLSHLGLIPDPEFGWPVGFSRKNVQHLGGLPSVGINCAACHIAEITSRNGGTTSVSSRTGPASASVRRGEQSPSVQRIRILGVTSHFDVEAFFGSVLIATFKTVEPENLKRFLHSFVDLWEEKRAGGFDYLWQRQQERILETIKRDPFRSNGIAPGELYSISFTGLSAGKSEYDLAELADTTLKLFHNMRAALHIPDQPPDKVPPASGPGRNDAFGLLAASLLNSPQPYSPIKFGLVWNVDKRTWVHWDGNTKSPISRNLLASLGLGAALHGKHADLQFADVKRQTDLSEKIRPPKYPFKIDNEAAQRGSVLFAANCNPCHGGPESDKRLFSVADVGTDPHRAEMFTQKLADGFNKFLAELEAEGYQPPKEVGVRSTGKYWAATLSGVWARSPYLHNGSVRTMHDLLTSPSQRAKTFKRGAREYDTTAMGYSDAGAYVFDTNASGNANSGHDYGTKLSEKEKRDLIEYLKTR